LNIARMIAQTAATIANTVATYVAATFSFFGYAKGGLVKGMARGGSVEPRGYAVGGAATLPRPSNIPASDTVPAWLTPGEFVVRRDAVKKYGVGLLDRLNRGRIPSSFYEAGSGLRRSSSKVQHFASGGSVAKAAFEAESSSTRPVSVAFFDDRAAMKRWVKTTEGETAILNVVKQNSFLFK
jgi:hypothetical protein